MRGARIEPRGRSGGLPAACSGADAGDDEWHENARSPVARARLECAAAVCGGAVGLVGEERCLG